MYGIAVSVAACVRAGTRVDVAWIADPGGFADQDPTDALAITPGGGRIGSLLSGALDAQLADVAARGLASGRVVALEVGTVEALVAGLTAGGEVRCLIVPATVLPADLWQRLIAREPVRLDIAVDGDVVIDISLDTAAMEPSGTTASADRIVTVLRPVPRLVIVGRGAIADALERAAALLGWRVQVLADPDSVTGVVATLAPMDNVVVASHDLDLAGRALAAALSGEVGYIGALGARKMQQSRADWLAYRGITDLERVHGPAGLDVGAETPSEIAVAILAEALAVQSGRTLTSEHA